ncbi:hypothetical protein LTR05_007075 [Lithohypha guttulata]|uniref:GABA permease n=1 Tax=Lithohypha guttulata TaxID=1690604 RepID=A0AAN7SW92_9EURO|nr:hypothetical protein LTR05_007075 [Lithohypha guttulata]
METVRRLGQHVSGKKPGLAHEAGLARTVSSEAKLADLGYEQGMLGFSFSIVTCWTALAGVLIVGITSGGPPVMVWSWIAISICSLFVAYSFAEMCSAYPIAGGQYSWVAILAPKSIARSMSYVTGWFMITGIVAMGATNNFIAANFVLGMVVLNNPGYVIERWHTVLLTYLIAMLAAASNLTLSRFFERLSTGILVWNVCSFFIVIITILATNENKQSASFVFTEFQNDTGFASGGMAVMIGLLQSFFGMCCYDAPTHMTEEMLNPSVEAPRVIVMSVYLGAITGFIFLVSAFFCTSDIESVAGTATGVPVLQIFADSTGNIGAATFLGSLIAVIVLVCANSLMAEGSRSLYAFARDHGLPFSKIISSVNKKRAVPVFAILLCTAAQMVLNSLYFASYEGFSTVISISTFSFYLSYGMPLLARLLNLKTHRLIAGTAYSLGKYGPWLNAAGLLFLFFAGIDFNFPQVGPVTADNMNYCSAAFGVIGTIAVVTWFGGARKRFTGPDVQTQGQSVQMAFEDQVMTSDNEVEKSRSVIGSEEEKKA